MLKNDLRPSRTPRVSGVPLFARAAALVALFALPLTASAETALDPAYDRFKAVITGNTAAVSFGSDGTALAVPKSSAMGYVATGLSPTAGEVSRHAAFVTKYGDVPFKASQTITLGRLAKGLGALAGGPLGVGLFALSATADWFADSGLSLDPATGAVGASAWDGPCVAVTTSWGYRQTTGPSCFAAAEAMTAQLKAVPAINSGYVTKCFPSSTPATVAPGCGAGWNDGTGSTGVGYSMSYSGSPSQVVTPKTSAQIESALAGKPRTLSEIEQILSETIKYPEIQPDPVDWVRIDPINPGDYIKSPTKTDQKTTTNPDGSKIEETKSCWVKGTVQTGASLKLTEVCNTDTVTKTPSGTVTGTATATTESETADAATPEKDGFCATLLGKLVCADMDTPDDEVPKKTENVDFDPEDLGFGDGQCPPPYAWTDSAGSHEIDLSPYCDKLTTVVKPLVILFSLLAAFFIVAPGKPDGGV